MAKNISLKNVENLKTLRTIDEKLLSYNIEMTEVTGGTFWKAYTKGQIEGTEEFPLISFGKKDEMHQWYDRTGNSNLIHKDFLHQDTTASIPECSAAYYKDAHAKTSVSQQYS